MSHRGRWTLSGLGCGVGCALLLALPGCGGGDADTGAGSHGRSAGGSRGGPPPGVTADPPASAAVPVEVLPVVRRAISSFIQTNGTLEAENEVDLVARTTGPITTLLAEENQQVAKGQILARLDSDEARARLEIARVELEEAEVAHARAKSLVEANLVSAEAYDQAQARLDAARAQFSGAEIELAYTEIRAPFAGLVVRRYVRFAETVSVNQPLFRLSDFDPLLCPIRVPERELRRLAVGQRAYLTVEAWGDERFEARVDRVSPVVDAETGTVRVTLEVEPQGKLRPGMFASVFLETERRADALVIPKRALVLESLGDTVYVAENGAAERRDVVLGFLEGDHVEVVSGVAEGDPVIVIGQDGLADGTPIQVAGGAATSSRLDADPPAAVLESGAAALPGDDAGSARERVEAIKARMRERGLSEEEIEARLKAVRERTGGAGPGGARQ